MKLLKSWNNYKNSKHPNGRLTLRKNRFPLYYYSQFVFLAFVLLILSCEEKIPTIQNSGSFYSINTLTIPADSMMFAQAVANPESDVLYIGNDENIYAYTLLKFSFEGMFTDENEYIAKADLKVKIDPVTYDLHYSVEISGTIAVINLESLL